MAGIPAAIILIVRDMRQTLDRTVPAAPTAAQPLRRRPSAFGQRPETVAKYAETLRLVQETELTYVEIAARCGVGEGGLRNYLRVWHPALMQGRTRREPER